MALVVVGILVVLFVGGYGRRLRFTESNKFCGTDCHEMWPYRDTWAASTHKNADCVQCHIPPGTVELHQDEAGGVARGVGALHRPGQGADRVTRHIPNVACERSGCHTSARTLEDLSWAPRPVTFQHGSAGHTRQLCIACHASLVHARRARRVGAAGQLHAVMLRVPHERHLELQLLPQAAARRAGARARTATACAPGSAARIFSHPQPLVGAHAALNCNQCHTKGTAVKPDGCVNCHGDQHNGLPHCVDCHTITGWSSRRPSCILRRASTCRAARCLCPCDACHLQGYGQPASCPCHGGSPPSGG